MNEVLFDKFINGEIIVNTQTEDEFDLLMEYLGGTTDVNWRMLNKPTSGVSAYRAYGGKTCLIIENGSMTFNKDKYYRENYDKEIVECEILMNSRASRDEKGGN